MSGEVRPGAVSKPAISSKQCWGGYRRTTHRLFFFDEPQFPQNHFRALTAVLLLSVWGLRVFFSSRLLYRPGRRKARDCFPREGLSNVLYSERPVLPVQACKSQRPGRRLLTHYYGMPQTRTPLFYFLKNKFNSLSGRNAKTSLDASRKEASPNFRQYGLIPPCAGPTPHLRRRWNLHFRISKPVSYKRWPNRELRAWGYFFNFRIKALRIKLRLTLPILKIKDLLEISEGYWSQ